MANKRRQPRAIVTVEELLDSSQPEPKPFYPCARGGELSNQWADVPSGSGLIPPGTMDILDGKIKQRDKNIERKERTGE